MPDEKLSPEGQQEVEARIQAIFRKRGDRLSEAQRADIGRLVTEGQKPLEALRTFPLENSDQPGNTLRLYPDVRAARVASRASESEGAISTASSARFDARPERSPGAFRSGRKSALKSGSFGILN